MFGAVTFSGRVIRFIGKIIRFIASIMTWFMVLSLIGFAYYLINQVFPGFAYAIIAKGGILGNIFAWYYVHVYLGIPYVATITYYLATWGGSVFTALFRVLHNIFKFFGDKVYNFGEGMMAKAVASRAAKRKDENAAVAAELQRQIQANQELRAQNEKLRSRGLLRSGGGQRKQPGWTFDGLVARMKPKQKTYNTDDDQDDVWGRWSRRK